MYIIGKYILGRVANKNASPRVLKNGKASLAKSQDITARTYLYNCASQEVEPNPEILDHYNTRDRYAWTYNAEFIINKEMMDIAATEVGQVGKRMRQEKSVPPRSTRSCRVCDWKNLCRQDPSGEIAGWFGLRKREGYSGASDSYTFNGRTLRSDKSMILSPSQASTYMACPRQWWFDYKQGQEIARPAWRSVSSRTRGTLIHQACEAMGHELIHRGGRPFHPATEWDGLVMTARRVISGSIHKLIEQGIDLESEDDPEWRYDDMIDTSVRLFIKATESLYIVLEVEQRRIFRIPGHYMWMTCQPDLVGRDANGNIVIVDYKSTNSLHLDTVAEGYLHNPAMHLYAYAFQHGHPVKGEMDNA